MKYRSWIKRQLQQAGGAEYLRRLEIDIGAEPGHFRKELEEGLISGKKFGSINGATGRSLGLPPIRAYLSKV